MTYGFDFDPVVRNSQGGRWNPTPPIESLHPILKPQTLAQVEEGWETAAKWVAFRVKAKRSDCPRADWYTDVDPEWPAHLYWEQQVNPVPPLVLQPLIELTRELLGCTRIMAVCQIVGMDTAPGVIHEITRWAVGNRPEANGEFSVTPAKEYRQAEGADDCFIELAFGLPEHCTDGITSLMNVDFAEKFIQEQIMCDQFLADESWIYGLRPVKVLERLTGLSADVIACVPTPAMGEDPEGHSAFWRFIEDRAKQFLNGHRVDAAITGLGAHGGLARVAAGVHYPLASFRGEQIGEELAKMSSPWWDKIETAKAAGWPKVAA